MTFKQITLFTFIIFLLIGTTETKACSCGRVGIFKGKKQSEIVFKGTITNITELQISEHYYPSSESKEDYILYEFEFEIQAIFKGEKKFKDSQTVKIRTTGGGADCGNWFEPGTNHLVYSYITDQLPRNGTKTEEYLTTSLCTRTKKANFLAFFEAIVLTIF